MHHPHVRCVDGQASWIVVGTDWAEPDDVARSSRNPTRDQARVLERDHEGYQGITSEDAAAVADVSSEVGLIGSGGVAVCPRLP